MTKVPSARKARREPSLPAPASAMGLYTADGARKYLTAGEREAFLRAAERADREARTLCMTLDYGGCRLSEALALTADRVDLAGGLLLFESLKKRRRGIHRAVPVPPALLDALDLVHGIRKQQGRRGKGRGVRLWPWSRMTGWRVVHRVMQDAGLAGPHAKKTRAIADQAAADGNITPLEVMLHTMRAALLDGDLPLAASIARDAAPYCHPRLSAITVKEENIDIDDVRTMTDAELEARIRHLQEAGKPPGAAH